MVAISFNTGPEDYKPPIWAATAFKPITTDVTTSGVDIVAANRFLDSISEGEAVTFQTFDDDAARKDRDLVRLMHGDLSEVAQELTALNERGAGVFWTPNRTDGKGRKSENVVEVRAVFLDLDGAPLDPVLAAAHAAARDPHAVVETSPGKWHVYWRVEGCPLDTFAAVQRALASKFSGDPSICDLPRVMRLPGFVHRKGQPFTSRIETLEPRQPYLLEELVRRLQLDLRAPSASTLRLATPDIGAGFGAGKIGPGGRHAHLVKWTGELNWRGMPREAIHTAVMFENQRACDPPKSEAEVRAIVDDILRRYATQHGRDLANADVGAKLVVKKPDDFVQPSAEVSQQPRPLPDELPPVDALPLDALPEAFRPWVTDVANRMQCAPEFVAMPMLAAAAMLVARKATIRPQENTDWTERSNLWVLMVGRPGVMKSPAMKQALAPLERLEAQSAAEQKKEQAAFEFEVEVFELRRDAAKAAAKKALQKNLSADVQAHLTGDEPVPPTWRRYIVNDLTYEKLGVIMSENPGGILCVRDELRGLLTQLGREDHAPARAMILQAWSGGPYTFDRIVRGTTTIDDACLSIVGCIQPGPISELVRQARSGAADDGMLDRFIVIWPDQNKDWVEVDTESDIKARDAAWEVFERLDKLSAEEIGATPDISSMGGLPYLRFDPEALDAFREWRREHEVKLRTVDNEGMEGVLAKYRHHVPALALALHVIDGGVGPIGLEPTLRAIKLAKYLVSHADRLYASARCSKVRAARSILSKARSGALPDLFTARRVHQSGWSGLTDRAVVGDALDLLAEYGWLHETAVQTGGRPTVHYSLTDGARRG